MFKIKIFNKFICSGIFYITFFVSSFAQIPELKFRHLNVEHGLSQSTVRAIFQDKMGFMWFGTDIGINKYDGSEFTVYRYNAADPDGIPSNFIIEILEDSYGKFWIGTGYAGLSIFNREKETFENYVYDGDDSTSLSNNSIRAIFEDSRRNLWIGTAGGGLNLFNRTNNSFIRYSHHEGSLTDIGSNYISSIAEDKEGYLWLASPEGIITRFDHRTGKGRSIRLYPKPTDLQTTTFGQIMVDSENNVWFCTENGLYFYNQKKDQIRHYVKGNSKNHLNEDAVSDILEIGNGIYLISTDHGGINIFNKNTGEFTYHTHKEYDPESISNDQVYDIYRTADGIIWVGNFNGGVNIYDPDAQKFNTYSDLPLIQGLSFSQGSVLSIFEDRDHKIWMGYDGQGIDIYDPARGTVSNIRAVPGNRNSIPSNSVVEIYQTRNGDMWIGTYLMGMSVIDHNTGKYTHYRHDAGNPNSIGGNNVWSILEDREGKIWLGFQGNGVDCFDPRTKEFIHYRYHPDDTTSISNNDVYKIFEDSSGDIWISTRNGLCKHIKDQKGFKRYLSGRDLVNGIYGNCMYDIYQDNLGNIWIGSDQALNLYDLQKDRFDHYLESDGLGGNAVLSITSDNNGNLWLSTNKGISRFCIDSRQFRNYDRADGLISDEFNYVSVIKSSDNKIFFGSKKGFNYFDPLKILDNPRVPPVYFTSIRIFNEVARPGDESRILEKHITFTDRITLSHDQAIFTLGFAALNYSNPEKNQYSYKLEGVDAGWRSLGHRKEVTYTYLDPGHYKLTVRGSNSDGVWNEQGASLEIVILPPWYKSIWFRISIYITAIGLFLLFYLLRLRFFSVQKKKLMVLVRERTLQLEEVAVALEEKQEEINSQNEKLINQRNELELSNKLLTDQKIQILEQNKELDLHRNQLESLIEERTRELIEAKNKAEESDRLKSSFLANLSHEIRTPLNAILGFSSLLGERNLDPAERDEYNRIIRGSSNHLLELINDILDISKIEAGQMELDMREVSVNALINDISGLFDVLIKKEDGSRKPVLFKVAVEQQIKDMRIVSDPLRLNQIITNLINNAIKFTNEGFIEFGCIQISGSELLEFYVKDTGIGIKEEHQALVFERFRKLEDNRLQLHRGTGLGLAISSQLVGLMGGSMRVESKYGEGSTFFFTIPLIHVTQSAVSERKINRTIKYPDLKNCRILIAEDEPSNYYYVQKLLGDTGASVFHAENGLQVLDFLEKDKEISLVLMDIKMPGMNGIEALHEMRKRGYDIPVIAQTAYALADEIVKLKKEGFTEYIPKPIQKDLLFELIKKSLRPSKE